MVRRQATVSVCGRQGARARVTRTPLPHSKLAPPEPPLSSSHSPFPKLASKLSGLPPLLPKTAPPSPHRNSLSPHAKRRRHVLLAPPLRFFRRRQRIQKYLPLPSAAASGVRCLPGIQSEQPFPDPLPLTQHVRRPLVINLPLSISKKKGGKKKSHCSYRLAFPSLQTLVRCFPRLLQHTAPRREDFRSRRRRAARFRFSSKPRLPSDAFGPRALRRRLPGVLTWSWTPDTADSAKEPQAETHVDRL